ncbi:MULTISPECIES: glycosyltransferase family 4 protein [unclassified Brucella]|uniref:MraY family glycosyltransferase n=1 Tax=unclassified Brucella TaxID=2632610 RepID=UPI0012AE916A|nr:MULTISPECIES: glycosyltransferase family 4 protein [unclassified Brucella]MRN42351.1 glycoside hydrolase [Brucella sp. 09RB8913]MRN58665.1 glycoside hydrolase [Brucella sp. 09RB8918]
MRFLLVSFFVSALLCGIGLFLLSHLLPANFLAARMSSRSNHSIAARQIGGLALIPAILVTLAIFTPDLEVNMQLFLCLSGASLLLWAIGGLDDRYELSEIIRLGSQFLAAITVLYGLGPDFRLLPNLLPYWLEATLIVFALIIAINVTNFMDGLDLMTVAGLGVPLVGIALLGAMGLTGLTSSGIGAVAAGGLLGFALFNRPPASIFLGDSGSPPLGLIAGTALLLLARETHIVVALVLPLYYILDAGTTIVMRAAQGENILKAHSKHAYQIAKRGGWSVPKVVAHVALLNAILIACVVALLALDHPLAQLAFLLVAAVATLILLLDFRGRFRKL